MNDFVNAKSHACKKETSAVVEENQGNNYYWLLNDSEQTNNLNHASWIMSIKMSTKPMAQEKPNCLSIIP